MALLSFTRLHRTVVRLLVYSPLLGSKKKPKKKNSSMALPTPLYKISQDCAMALLIGSKGLCYGSTQLCQAPKNCAMALLSSTRLHRTVGWLYSLGSTRFHRTVLWLYSPLLGSKKIVLMALHSHSGQFAYDMHLLSQLVLLCQYS